MLGMTTQGPEGGALIPLRKPTRFVVSRKPPLWMTSTRERSRQMAPPPHVPINAPDQVAYHMGQQWTQNHQRQMSGCPQPLEAESFFTDVFTYGVDFVAQNNGVAIAAGATVQGTLNLEQASDFVWTKTTFERDPLGARMAIRIFDEATNRSLSNIALDVDAYIGGSAQRPAINAAMRVCPANSTVFFELVNNSANPVTMAVLLLHGYKIYYPDRLNRTGGMQSC